jgi:DNA polymerase I-like protein with 3'-5' exonuclease and polymerase domains
VRLRALAQHIGQTTGRIHSSFDDRQATGRVASSYPNLQQLAKPRTIAEQEVRSRNALRASPGFELAVFDIGQADIRVLAHGVESLGRSTEEHQNALRQQRRARLEAQIGTFDCQRAALRNPLFVGEHKAPPPFNPTMAADLAKDFRDTQGDFYTTAVKRILGREPKDKQERNRFKVIILSVVNSMGPPSLAKDLGCTEEQAKGFLTAFEHAYPKVAGYKWLMHWQTAYTGQTATFTGRTRTMTAHH